MNTRIFRSFELEIYPSTTRNRLLSRLDVIPGSVIRSVQIPRDTDPYILQVDFICPGEFVSFDQAVSIVETFGYRRFLSLGELLNLNLSDFSIRNRWPIFTDKYVLEYLLQDSASDDSDADDEERKWRIESSSAHRGQVIDSDSLFVTTPLTLVDRGMLTVESLSGISTISPGGSGHKQA